MLVVCQRFLNLKRVKQLKCFVVWPAAHKVIAGATTQCIRHLRTQAKVVVASNMAVIFTSSSIPRWSCCTYCCGISFKTAAGGTSLDKVFHVTTHTSASAATHCCHETIRQAAITSYTAHCRRTRTPKDAGQYRRVCGVDALPEICSSCFRCHYIRRTM